MKKVILIFAAIAAVVVLASCGGGGSNKTTETAQATETVETTKPAEPIEPAEVVEQVKTVDNTPATTVISLDDSYDKHYKRQRITDEERQELKIDNIKFKDFGTATNFGKHKNKMLAKGKLIYCGANGRLETIMLIEAPDGNTLEYLVSYNAQGEYVDCIRVGCIFSYAGDRGSSKINLKSVTYNSYYPAEGEDEGGENTYKYRITDDLKFVEIK